MLQISNVFRVTSMSIERFVKKYKYIFSIQSWCLELLFFVVQHLSCEYYCQLAIRMNGDRQLADIDQSAGADTQPVLS